MDAALKQQIVSILEAGRDLTLATVRPDGAPQATTRRPRRRNTRAIGQKPVIDACTRLAPTNTVSHIHPG